MSTTRDHYTHGSLAANPATGAVSGSFFGILVLANNTTFSALSTDADNNAVLAGVTYSAGMYIPVGVNSFTLSAGAILVGKNYKRQLT